MKEEDIAKLAFAAIIDAVKEFRSGYDEQQLKDFDVAFPNAVMVNGNIYIFARDGITPTKSSGSS